MVPISDTHSRTIHSKSLAARIGISRGSHSIGSMRAMQGMKVCSSLVVLLLATMRVIIARNVTMVVCARSCVAMFGSTVSRFLLGIRATCLFLCKLLKEFWGVCKNRTRMADGQPFKLVGEQFDDPEASEFAFELDTGIWETSAVGAVNVQPKEIAKVSLVLLDRFRKSYLYNFHV